MINIDLETTEPSISLDMITLDTVRPFLDLREGKTGQARWLNAVIILLTMSPRERAAWLISSSAEGCYPIKGACRGEPTGKQAVVWHRICLELEMVSATDKEESLPIAHDWMQYAFDGDELILQEDDKEEILTGDTLRDLMKALLLESSAIQESLYNHATKLKSVDTWFNENHDLIAEDAWHYNWTEIVYG
jgi:hypothetical protein